MSWFMVWFCICCYCVYVRIYGLSMISALKDFSWKKHYIIFGLTDETFALLKTNDVDENEREKVYLIITALNQSYWVIGSVLGAFLGNVLPFNYKGIEFSLTALFVVLSIDLYNKSKQQKPFLISIVSPATATHLLM